MPIYEYRCAACRNDFEELARSINADPEVQCPACGSGSVERKLSLFAAHQAAPAAPGPAGSGCARCGDPDGPCSI